MHFIVILTDFDEQLITIDKLLRNNSSFLRFSCFPSKICQQIRQKMTNDFVNSSFLVTSSSSSASEEVAVAVQERELPVGPGAVLVQPQADDLRRTRFAHRRGTVG